MVLYAADIPVIYADLLRRYPFFRSTEEERQAMFDRSENVKMVRPTARVAQRLAELEAEEQVA
jgi:hypothetical protein